MELQYQVGTLLFSPMTWHACVPKRNPDFPLYLASLE